MAKYKVVTQKPAGVTFDLADGQYLLERESLDSIDAEIIEIDATQIVTDLMSLGIMQSITSNLSN